MGDNGTLKSTMSGSMPIICSSATAGSSPVDSVNDSSCNYFLVFVCFLRVDGFFFGAVADSFMGDMKPRSSSLSCFGYAKASSPSNDSSFSDCFWTLTVRLPDCYSTSTSLITFRSFCRDCGATFSSSVSGNSAPNSCVAAAELLWDFATRLLLFLP